MLKHCSRCRQDFPATPEFFYRHSSGQAGLRSDCKSCFRNVTAAYCRRAPPTPKPPRAKPPSPPPPLPFKAGDTRLCSRCQKELPATLEFFSRQSRRTDGLQVWCKICQQDANRTTRQNATPERKQQLASYRTEFSRKRRANPELATRERERNYVLYRELKNIVLDHYSSPCRRCACCGEIHDAFLSLDHIHGGGGKHRKKIGTGFAYWRWFIQNDFPTGYQVLCHNCNQAKGYFGTCPHEQERAQTTEAESQDTLCTS